MLLAKTLDGLLHLATETQKSTGPFFCSVCGGDAVLKKGSWRIHHYAHRRLATACAKAGESELHAVTKLAIYNDARSRGLETFIEYPLGERIADVVLHLTGGRKIAVEVQLSPIGVDEIFARTANHSRLGYSVLWVVVLPVALDEVAAEPGSQYKIRAFQRDIHDHYGEALFQYRDKLFFDVIHLMGYKYERFKYYKVMYKPVHILNTVDEIDGTHRYTTVAEPLRWWTRLSNSRSVPWGSFSSSRPTREF